MRTCSALVMLSLVFAVDIVQASGKAALRVSLTVVDRCDIRTGQIGPSVSCSDGVSGIVAMPAATSSRHPRVADLTLLRPGDRRLLVPDLADYVLAGRYKHWPLLSDGPDLRPASRLQAEVNGETAVLDPDQALLTGP